MSPPPLARLSIEDRTLVLKHLGGNRDRLDQPDLTIAPDGKPYLHRWHLTPRGRDGNSYLHVQVADDPERPLHDHPWDNTSYILVGGYREVIQAEPPNGPVEEFIRRPGDVIYREARAAHRLFLPKGTPYTITLFDTGPHVREWGFWAEKDGKPDWVHNEKVIETLPDGRSVWRGFD